MLQKKPFDLGCISCEQANQAVTDNNPHTLPLLLALGLVVLTLLVLRRLNLLASDMPLAITMRIHMGSRISPTKVM